MKEWLKEQWRKRPWLLGIIAGGLIAIGYWIYTKAKGPKQDALGSATGVVSIPQTGSGGGGEAAADASVVQSLVSALQQQQQANTDVLTTEIAASTNANRSLFDSLQQKFDALTAFVRDKTNIAQQQVSLAPGASIAPIVPVATAVPIISPIIPVTPVVPVVPPTIPSSNPAAAAVAIIAQAASNGLLTPAAASNMTAAVNAVPVPAGTPTGSDIYLPAGASPYPTGVSVAQGAAMAQAFASTPYTPNTTPQPSSGIHVPIYVPSRTSKAVQ